MMLEYEVKNDPGSARNAQCLKRLDWIEENVTATWPPLSFAQERYALHAHIRAVRHEIERHGGRAEQAEEATETRATKANS